MKEQGAPEKKLRNFDSYSLEEMDNFYRQGVATEAETIAYIKKWNQGIRFTQAIIQNTRILNFDPEKSGNAYRHLQEKFQLNLPEQKTT